MKYKLPDSWHTALAGIDRKEKIRQAKLSPLVGKCKIQDTRASSDPPWAPDLLIEGMPWRWWVRLIRLAETMKMDPMDGMIECLYFGMESLETQYGLVDSRREWPESEIIRAEAHVMATDMQPHRERLIRPQKSEKQRQKNYLRTAERALSSAVENMEDGGKAFLMKHGFQQD